MTVVRTYPTRDEALAAAQRLIEYRLEARVTEEPGGEFAVRLAGGSRSLATDILDHGRPRFDRTMPWARSRTAPRLSMSQFAVVAGGAVAVFLLWMGLTDAYGAPVVIAVAIATATFAAGLWFVVPEAFEIDEVRSATAEVLAIGILLALAQRVLFDLVRLGASPYHSYPLWQWTIAALGPLLVFVVLVGSLVREREQTRIRRVMTLFGGAGLAYAVVASATYVLDIGFTAGRWGLVPVWAVLGIYPILSVPIHVFGAGILGWGWASGRNQLIGAVVGVTVATGLFHFATVRSPFWGPLIVVAFGATWMWLFAKHPQNAPMVARVPDHLLDKADRIWRGDA